ncbi:hypothetical protein QUA45_03505 [Microcoleus sp. Pol12A5]
MPDKRWSRKFLDLNPYDCRLQPMATQSELYNVHAQKSFGAERSLYFLTIGRRVVLDEM